VCCWAVLRPVWLLLTRRMAETGSALLNRAVVSSYVFVCLVKLEKRLVVIVSWRWNDVVVRD